MKCFLTELFLKDCFRPLLILCFLRRGLLFLSLLLSYLRLFLFRAKTLSKYRSTAET